MKTKNLLLLAVLTSSTTVGSLALSAQAIVITVGGQDYNITTFNGTYDDNTALLQSQPWWGDGGAAQDFALALAVRIGINGASTFSQAATQYTNAGLGFTTDNTTMTRGPIFAFSDAS